MPCTVQTSCVKFALAWLQTGGEWYWQKNEIWIVSDIFLDNRYETFCIFCTRAWQHTVFSQAVCIWGVKYSKVVAESISLELAACLLQCNYWQRLLLYVLLSVAFLVVRHFFFGRMIPLKFTECVFVLARWLVQPCRGQLTPRSVRWLVCI